MSWRLFGVILHSPTTPCPSACPQCHPPHPTPVWVLLDLLIMKMSFSLCPSFLCIPPLSNTPPFSFFHHLSPQPFMSPRYPGGPRPSLRMPNQVLGNEWEMSKSSSMLISTTHRLFVLPRMCQYINQFPCLVFPQPPGGIPGSQPLLPNSLDPTRPQGTIGKDVARSCKSLIGKIGACKYLDFLFDKLLWEKV